MEEFARHLPAPGIVAAPNRLSDAEWGVRLQQLLEDVRSRLPAGMTPEEIEAEVTTTRAVSRRSANPGAKFPPGH